MQRCLHIWNLEPSSLFIFKIFYLPLISNIPRHHYKDDRILPKNQIGQMFTFYLINRYPRKYIFVNITTFLPQEIWLSLHIRDQVRSHCQTHKLSCHHCSGFLVYSQTNVSMHICHWMSWEKIVWLDNNHCWPPGRSLQLLLQRHLHSSLSHVDPLCNMHNRDHHIHLCMQPVNICTLI